MKKIFSLLLVCVLVVSCLTGCTSTTKVKVSADGKITGTNIMDITDEEYREYCEAMAYGDETEDDASYEDEEDEDDSYVDDEDDEDDDGEDEAEVEDEDASEADFEEYYAECVKGLLEQGYVKKKDNKGNVYYRLSEPLDDTEGIEKEVKPTYCKIKLTNDDKKEMEKYSDMSSVMTVKLQVTFPYKVKKTNGKLSKDKKTVTWDLLKMKNKSLTAYTVKYKK